MARRRALYLPALLVAAAVLMACAAAVLAVPKEAEATFPGKNGKIAYQDWSSAVIYTINPNGSGKTKVTGSCVYPSLPDYSPTGKKITYEGCEAGNTSSCCDTEIYTINSNGTGKFQLTNNGTIDQTPSYSPDGKKLAYSRGSDRNSAIYTIDVGGEGESKVTEGGYPSWGPHP